MDAVRDWVGLSLQLVGLVVVAVSGLWAYTRYVLERGLLPPTELTIDAVTLPGEGAFVVEVSVELRNLGSAPVIVRDVVVDFRYLTSSDPVCNASQPTLGYFGQVVFPHSVRKDLRATAGMEVQARESGSGRDERRRGFLVTPEHTFVQGGVAQTYSFVTSVSDAGRYLLVQASLWYVRRPSGTQKALLALGRLVGLVSHTLTNLDAPHRAQRVFPLSRTPPRVGRSRAATPPGARPTMVRGPRVPPEQLAFATRAAGSPWGVKWRPRESGNSSLLHRMLRASRSKTSRASVRFKTQR